MDIFMRQKGKSDRKKLIWSWMLALVIKQQAHFKIEVIE